MATEREEQKSISINTTDETSKGRYSNAMFVAHGPEEFIIDWLLNSPNGAHLLSRIVVAPGHMKRICNALQENIKVYEQNFGVIKENDPSPRLVQ